MPMFKPPSSNMRCQCCRITVKGKNGNINRPGTSTRKAAIHNGSMSAIQCWVTAYVVPHNNGASTPISQYFMPINLALPSDKDS